MVQKHFTAFIEREGDGYVSLCPGLDIASQGNTIEEARGSAARQPYWDAHLPDTTVTVPVPSTRNCVWVPFNRSSVSPAYVGVSSRRNPSCDEALLAYKILNDWGIEGLKVMEIA